MTSPTHPKATPHLRSGLFGALKNFRELEARISALIICHAKVVVSVVISEMVNAHVLRHGEVIGQGDAVKARYNAPGTARPVSFPISSASRSASRVRSAISFSRSLVCFAATVSSISGFFAVSS